jgi:hypothetical protein
MIINRRLAAFLSVLLLSILFLACENPLDPNNVGLGAEVDLVGPILTIMSPVPMAYVGPDFTISGTCRDNVKVTRVVVEDTGSGQTWNGTVDGETWSLSLSLPEGEQTIRVTAYDQKGNTSSDSTRTLTVIVDNTPPAVNTDSIRVARSPLYKARLSSLADLKAVGEPSLETIDMVQNGSFTLGGASNDNFRLDSLALNLRGEDDALILTRTITDGDLPDAGWSGSLYNWIFNLDGDDLYDAGIPAADGRVYLKVNFVTVDKHGNDGDTYCGWIALDPDSDIPWAQTEGMDLPLSVQTSSPLAFSGIDDDGVAAVYGLVAASGAPVPEITDMTLLADGGASDPRLLPVQVNAPAVPGLYVVYLAVEDTGGRTGFRSWPLTVLDASFPVSVVTSPAENTFPALTGGTTFTLSGYCYDNSGIEELRIAWIPVSLGEGMLGTAETALASFTGTVPDTTPEGIVIRPVTLGAPASMTAPDGSPAWRRDFTSSWHITNDFTFNGNPEYASRFFVLYAEDNLGNATVQTFRVGADRSSPVLTILNPAAEVGSHDPDSDLVLRFTAVKGNGMAVPVIGVTETVSGTVYTPVFTSGEWRVTIPSSSLTEGRFVYDFEAVDLFGNRSTARRTVFVTDRPVLQRITSSAADGRYKTGDALTFQAVFSTPVVVTGTPELMLIPVDGNPPRAASCSGGSGTDTLTFAYTVQAGDNTADLACSFPSPLVLTGDTIRNADGLDAVVVLENTASALQGQKALVLDGINPALTTAVIAAGSWGPGADVDITVTLSEPVYVSGSPVFAFGTALGLQASFVSASGNALTFRYRVTAGINENPAAWHTRGSLLAGASSILDLAGNPLTLAATGASVSSSVVIDTAEPSAPLISSPAAGTWNTAQSLVLGGLEPGAAAEYSLDGGFTWFPWTAPVNLTSGSYNLTARQRDAAGNMSPRTAGRSVVINTTFPTVTAVVCEQPNGTYKAGDSLVFKLVFSAPVRAVTGSGTPSLSLGAGGEKALGRAEPSGDTVLWFDYTVPAGVVLTPVTVTGSDLTGVTDLFGNTAAATPVLPAFIRPLLRVDGLAPAISSRSPVSGTGTVVSGTSPVFTLTFNEAVSRASGTITVRRRSGWLIPPVMSVDEFNAVYNNASLTAADRQILMETSGGFPVLDTATGQPVGPYKLETHGMILSAGSKVPDTTGKYVLDYAYDLDDAAIRTVLEAAGYHQVTLDVLSSQVSVSGSVATITLGEPLPVGRDWEILIEAGAFEDAAGNGSAAIAAGQWIFSTDKVAPPVVRVNKTSGDSKTAAHPVTTTFRIDCETPGAAVTYITAASTYTDNTATMYEYEAPGRHITTVADRDAFQTVITGAGAPVTAYTVPVTIGDGLYTTAQRIYIKTAATKSGYTASDTGEEGAYKTVARLHRTGTLNPTNAAAYFYVRGSCNGGGPVTLPGFPIRWLQTSEAVYAKRVYFDNTPANSWTWVSWQVAGDFEYKFVRNTSATWIDTGNSWIANNNLQGSWGALSVYTGAF